MSTDISAICNVRGFIAACRVDGEKGKTVERAESGADFDLDAAAAAHTEVIRAKSAAIQALGMKRNIDDILITLGGQYHLIRPLAKQPNGFLFVALDRNTADLGKARLALRKIEATVP